MNQRGLILWQKKDKQRLIWLGILFIILAGVVVGQIYKNRQWKQQLDKNSYAYIEGAVIRALNNPRSLSIQDYQTAKQLGVIDNLLKEHPNYKPKLTRLIQIVERKKKQSEGKSVSQTTKSKSDLKKTKTKQKIDSKSTKNKKQTKPTLSTKSTSKKK